MSLLIPVVNLGLLYVNNLQLSVASNTTLTMQAGQARDSTNVQDIVLSSSVTINAAVNGANGLDTGTFAASTLYYVFVIGSSNNSEPTAAIMSLSATAPTLPFGYDMIRRVGVAVADGTVHFRPLNQTGNGNERKYQYNGYVATAITAGHATTATAVSLANIVPNVNTITPVNVYYSYTPATAGNALQLSSTTNLTGVTTITGQVASVAFTGVAEVLSTIVSSNQTIYYSASNSSDTTALSILGFTDFL